MCVRQLVVKINIRLMVVKIFVRLLEAKIRGLLKVMVCERLMEVKDMYATDSS